MRITTVHKLIDEYILPVKAHSPRVVYLVVDGTYFGSKNNDSSFCVIVFRDVILKENIWWKFCDVERESYYREGKVYLENLGYVITSLTGDGSALIRRAFVGVPFPNVPSAYETHCD